jgi:hypothetical protein
MTNREEILMTDPGSDAPRKRARFASFALLAASLLLVLDVSAAAAAVHPGDYVIRTKSIAVAGNVPGTGGGKATCPQGMLVVTGGAWWHRPGEGRSDEHSAYLGASAPTANGRSWMASGIQWEAETLTLEIVAYCLPASAVGTYSIRTHAVTVNGKQVGVAEASCPTNKQLVTGGYWWHRPGEPWNKGLEVYARSAFPRPSAAGWYSAAWNDSTEALVLVSVALCRPSSWVGTYVIKKTDVSISYTGAAPVGHGTPACGMGRRAVPGGAYWHRTGAGVEPEFVAWLKGSAPIEGGRRWYASGQNNDDEDLELRVLMLCLPA